MISSGGAVVDSGRASHVAPALSFPPHHPLYPPTVTEFLRPPLPPRYRHPANSATIGGANGTSAASSISTTQQQAQSAVPGSTVTSSLAIARTLNKEEDDYPSYRLYPYPYPPYSPYLYPLVRPLDFSYTSPPHSPLVNNTTTAGNASRGNKPIQISAPPSLPPPVAAISTAPTTIQLTVSTCSNTISSRGASGTITQASTLPPPLSHPLTQQPPPTAPPSSSVTTSSSTSTTLGNAKEPLKSRLLRKRSRAGPTASFARGSLIRLASGELRRVEEMRTEDFITSAETCPALRLDPSTVVRIDSPPDSSSAILTLSYGQHRSQTEVECTADHPYFVYGHGWASCRPDRTLAAYGLKVHQLQVGDVCISLTPRVSGGASTLNFNGNNRQLLASSLSNSASVSAAHNGAIPPLLLDRKRRWSAPDEIHELPPPAHQQSAKD